MRSLVANLLRWTADLIAPRRSEYRVPINRVTTTDMHAAWDVPADLAAWTHDGWERGQ